jgi:hypothetical protein
MVIDNNERSNRGGAGGIIGYFLSIGKELGGKEAEISESPRTRAESRPLGETPSRDDYPASALKERIYLLPRLPRQPIQRGILI